MERFWYGQSKFSLVRRLLRMSRDGSRVVGPPPVQMINITRMSDIFTAPPRFADGLLIDSPF